MNSRLLAFFILLLTNIAAAQDSYPDSLKRELGKAIEDTSKVNLLSDLSAYYQWSYPDSTLPYALEGLALGKKLDFERGQIYCYEALLQALAVKGNFANALDMGFKALKLAEKSSDQVTIYWTWLNIGAAYTYAGDHQNALTYYLKAKANKQLRPRDTKLVAGFIGESYFSLNQLDSAAVYIQQCYDLDIKDSFHWSVPYYYMAAISSRKERYKEALDYYHAGINITTENKDLIDGYNGLAAVFNKSGQVDSAVYYAKLAVRSGQQATFIPEVIVASSLLTDIYSIQHNQDSAFKYQRLLLAMKDSLFSKEKVKEIENLSFNEQIRQQEIATERKQLQNKIRMYALGAALLIFFLIAFILWRSNKHKQKAYALLQKQKQEIDIQKAKAEKALDDLKATQAQLVQSEKMASLGELTAGIAHEIQNPLNFVNNFSEVSNELIGEMVQAVDNGNGAEIKSIAADVKQNLEKILHHGKRADAIVKGMLQHSRSGSEVREPTDINALADEYLRLSYHGLRSKNNAFNATLQTNFDPGIGAITITPQDIGRVLLNLYNNAFYAITERKKQMGESFQPTVAVHTSQSKSNDGKVVEILVKDNGIGIPQKILDKIFQPFFTTKPTGQGTGLGLSLAYDIIKAHGGTLKVKTQEGEGSEFIIQLPVA